MMQKENCHPKVEHPEKIRQKYLEAQNSIRRGFKGYGYRLDVYKLKILWNKAPHLLLREQKKRFQSYQKNPPPPRDSLGVHALQEVASYELLSKKILQFELNKISLIKTYSSAFQFLKKELLLQEKILKGMESTYQLRLNCRAKDINHRIQRGRELTDDTPSSSQSSAKKQIFTLIHQRYVKVFTSPSKKNHPSNFLY